MMDDACCLEPIHAVWSDNGSRGLVYAVSQPVLRPGAVRPVGLSAAGLPLFVCLGNYRPC